ncbi:hypothetical protein FACS1894174_09990 [Bacteroidia bacterium]|nr:hypothetical protein FACS1894174_09990 [Bacteroidia bacterium]
MNYLCPGIFSKTAVSNGYDCKDIQQRLTIINDLLMEMKNLGKVEALSIKALLKDVKELKNDLEVKNFKEEIIAKVLQEQDKEVLMKVAKVLCDDTLAPRKEGNRETPTGSQGNGISSEELDSGQEGEINE